ncbi:hypothetical protein BO94DRAFT_397592 [Aspergillus sclerotioniger CBS 115572]|uniref:2EXR domain-containing protein n=1 Tax=Aspergillus sclerotioniger CBS 115572 TaxID=1450535 RepID=A0A317X098_9EURO|nr:hypothetical protein BO94DRAFT_397592 [Aspergillus sclerotioniger CBS 115572]PWY91591.1 hypothetical protein BO94DRAFT_397592 [Aspergillus sclerotioniger CBS 115572]
MQRTQHPACIMTSQSHFEIFNLAHSARDSQPTFPDFLCLPIELRPNLIRVHLSTRTEGSSIQEARTIKERYCATVNGHQVLSKLWQVNREARKVALRFYRIHLPCMLRWGVPHDNATV